MLNWFIQHSPLFYLTQSLWRDEVFSILVAERPLSFIFQNLTFEPPFYYTLLHFWIKLFGNGELSTRGLSLLAFVLATVVVIYWAEKLYPKHWLSWYLPLFFFLNPMLLYYAFEVRTYGWYIFFATVSMYTYLTKKWRWYIAVTTLGFYTHAYMIVVPFVEGIHYIMTHTSLLKRPKMVFRDRTFLSMLAVGVLIAPWLIRVAQESSRLKSSWYFPVDLHLVKSVLGNMFIGYEGTPWYMWEYTKILSIILFIIFLFSLIPKLTRKTNSFFFLMVFVPLALVIGISFIKPLFVNRYLIAVSIAQVFLVVAAIAAVKHSLIQTTLAAAALVFILWINWWYPTKHPKLDMRATVRQINLLMESKDYLYAENPLIFFESIYYSRDRSRVFLYNPSHGAFPWYVGSAIVFDSQMIDRLPIYPNRAFLVHADGTFDIVYQTDALTGEKVSQKVP